MNKTFNNVKLNVAFSPAAERANVVSGENIANALGKVAKWYEDFHSVVWTGDAATVNGKTVESNVPADAKFTDTWEAMRGATASNAGAAGYVPAPAAGDNGKFLKGDGTWGSPDVPEYSAAGANLGLVKTGGDVQITDGIITISPSFDTSYDHTHAIDEVTGLQNALDAKVPTTRTINGNALSADITLDAAAVGADAAGSAAQALTDAKDYTDGKIDALVGEGASETLDTIGEISKAIEEHQEVTDALNAAIGNKADKTALETLDSEFDAHVADKNNPHAVTAAQVGLGKVENKTSAEILSQLVEGDNVSISQSGDSFTISAVDTTYSNATGSEAGLMSAAHYTKLEGIKAGAEVNQNAFSSVIAGGTTIAADAKEDSITIDAGENVTITGNASTGVVTIAAKDTTYSVMGAATSGADGTSGLVPAPTAGSQSAFLRGDGTWVVPTDTWTALKGATSSANGTAGYAPAPTTSGYAAYGSVNNQFLCGDGTWSTKPVIEEDTLILNCVAD